MPTSFSLPTSPSHVAWSSIDLLHNVVRSLAHLNAELGRALPVVDYRAKVKLHGSNCAVQRTTDGVVAQSRTSVLTPQADYKGFATWVQTHGAYFEALAPGLIVFGEWCGPGVEKGHGHLAGKEESLCCLRRARRSTPPCSS